MSTFNVKFGYIGSLLSRCKAVSTAQGSDDSDPTSNQVTHDDLEELPTPMLCSDVMKKYETMLEEARVDFEKKYPFESVKNGADVPSRVSLAYDPDVDRVTREVAILPMWKAVFQLVKRDLMVIACFATIRVGSMFLQIFALSAIIDVVGENGKYSEYNASSMGTEMLLAVCLGFAAYLQSLMHHNQFHNSWVNGIRARALLCGVIYQKALCQTPLHVGSSRAGKKNKKEKQQQNGSEGSQGQQMNLISSDSNIVTEAFAWLAFLVSAPFEVIGSLIWVFALAKWSAFGALALVSVLLPLQMKVGTIIGAQRAKSFGFADKRISVLSEFLSGIGVVKFNGWEVPMYNHISSLRKSESLHLVYGTTLKLLNMALFFITPGALAVVTIGVQNIYDSDMEPRKTFVVLALVQVVARTFVIVPRACAAWFSAFTSVDRIERFLMKNVGGGLPKDLGCSKTVDTEPFNQTSTDDSNKPIFEGFAEPGLVLVRGNYSWRKSRLNSASLSPVNVTSAASPLNMGSPNISSTFALRNVNFSAKQGSLSCVVGAVGSGKSTLLHAIMRNCAQLNTADMAEFDPLSREQTAEMSPDEFRTSQETAEGVVCNGTVAYVPQEAWIRDGTIRENILFGEEYDETRYWNVLRACSLITDIIQWGGDFVEAGEKGVTLSGGQRQRVAMARAVYSNAQIFLLDDPLSAVDAHVAKHLLENCITDDSVLGTKTVILVTHNTVAISKADQVVRFDEESGEFEKLDHDQVQRTLDRMNAEQHVGVVSSKSEKNVEGEAANPSEGNAEPTPPTNTNAAALEEEARSLLGQGRKLLSAESSALSGVGAGVYATYIKEGGKGKFIAFIVCVVLSQGIKNVADWWFAAWTNRDYDALSNRDYLLIEIGLVLVSTGIAIYRSVLYSGFTTTSSTRLHDRMFRSVLASPMHFFETVPLGRIINRFAKDLDYCDDLLPRVSYDFVQLIGMCIGSLALLVFSIPWFAIVVAVFMIVFGKLVQHYLPAARQMKRLEGSSRSPTHQTFQATLQGLTTIRAFGKQHIWQNHFYETVDVTSRAIITSDSTQRWVGCRMDWMTSSWVLAVGMFCVGFQDSLTQGIAGLALSQSLMLGGVLQFSVRMAAETESLMTAVERIDEYGRLPAEVDPYGEDAHQSTQHSDNGHEMLQVSEQPNQWPSHGHIVVKNLTVSYPSNPGVNVLSDVSFEIKPGEKFAIVGRTGAGKSTILQCFFRFVEIPEASIDIDGVLIGKMPLKALRRGLAIIPQSPTLFHGSLRYNLDPFGDHEDEELLQALYKVQLLRRLLRAALSAQEHDHAEHNDDVVQENADVECVATETIQQEDLGTSFDDVVKSLTEYEKNTLLGYNIGEQGGSLSVGQKQLVCAARALLKNPKVLLMDEATANVDSETDAALQATIHEACKDTTVITIAHRLNTIMSYHKVMVLSRGVLEELGNPRELCEENPDGPFGTMVKAASKGKDVDSAAE